MRDLINIIESVSGWERDPYIQFHLSIEPDLKPGLTFAQQTRTISQSGARGASGGEGIYTSRMPQYWQTQLDYERHAEQPRYVYLVRVADTEEYNAAREAAHQEVHKPHDVVVLAMLYHIPDGDNPVDWGKIYWLADRFVRTM